MTQYDQDEIQSRINSSKSKIITLLAVLFLSYIAYLLLDIEAKNFIKIILNYSISSPHYKYLIFISVIIYSLAGILYILDDINILTVINAIFYSATFILIFTDIFNQKLFITLAEKTSDFFEVGSINFSVGFYIFIYFSFSLFMFFIFNEIINLVYFLKISKKSEI